MKRVTILLAEDDFDDQQFFHDFLCSRDNLQLLPAVNNGEELMTVLESNADGKTLPDLIILDQNMPKRNGLQTLNQLKADSRYSSIPVMIYSTFVDDGLKKSAKDAGAVLVLSKPSTEHGYNFMIDELLETISQ